MAQRLWIELDRLNHEVKVPILTSSDEIILVIKAEKIEDLMNKQMENS